MPSPRTVEQFAPAKVNLTLHVTGRRADGYHLLDSLVVFVAVGDRLRVQAANVTALNVSGEFSRDIPTGADNLVMRAAALFDPPVTARISLIKNLPAASGIGGGSSDAAACLRGLAEIGDCPVPGVAEQMGLGADVPVCVAQQPARMRGIGEQVEPVTTIPPVHVVLVNPGAAVSTPSVFGSLERRDNPPMPDEMPNWLSASEFAAWIRLQRNDLEQSASTLAPQIRLCLDALSAQTGCLAARMSGSGATCFGLFAEQSRAAGATETLKHHHPSWWCAHGGLVGQGSGFR